MSEVNGSPLVQLNEVYKSYTTAAGPIQVLTGVNLKVERNKLVAIVGPSGSGKSTLLNILGALDSADSGEVLVNGADLAELSTAARANFRNRVVGFVFQLHHLLPQCTVLENVLVPSLVVEDPQARSGAKDRAMNLLSKAGLKGRRDHFPAQLSGGERLRAAVVRALINQPSLVLADEPTGSLDNITADTLADLLVEVNREENVTLIAVTHSERFAERFDTVYRLEKETLSCV